jgi:hypothetical protein
MLALIIAALLVVIFQPGTTVEIAWIVFYAFLVFAPCQAIEGVFEKYYEYKVKIKELEVKTKQP